jgi:hypothetical protein
MQQTSTLCTLSSLEVVCQMVVMPILDIFLVPCNAATKYLSLYPNRHIWYMYEFSESYDSHHLIIAHSHCMVE